PSCGTGGVCTTDPAARNKPDGIGAMSVMSDGRIVAAYEADPGIGGALRLTANGQPDPTFSGDGIAVVTGGNGSLTAVLVQDDGKVLLTGPKVPFFHQRTDWFFARLNADGTPDTTFGADGSGMAF